MEKRELSKKKFTAHCDPCDMEMTHLSKDYRTIYCTNCWESVPVPLDIVPNYVRLAELRRLKSLLD